MHVTDLGGAVLIPGTTFTLIDNTSLGAMVGTFVNLADDSFFRVDGNIFQADYEGGSGNDLTVTVASRADVPEQGASSLLLLGSSGLLLALLRPRNRLLSKHAK